MSSPVTFSGFNNIDFSVVLNSIMTASSQPLTDLQSHQSDISTQIANFKTLAGYTSTLRSAAEDLSNAATLAGFAATATDPSAMAVSAGPTATAGHYDVQVTELARAQIMATGPVSDPNSTIIANTGTITVNGVDVVVTRGLTLQGLADAINANDSVAATASVVQSGTNSFRLVLTARYTGRDNGFTVSNTLAGGAGLSFVDTDGDGVSGDDALDNAVQATDASLTVNNIPITSASNTLDAAIAGVTMTLFKKGVTVGVDVAPDNSALSTNVTAFVNAYNDLVNFATKQAAAAGKGDTTSIGRDPVLRGLRNSLRSTINSSFANSGALSYLSQAGLEFTQSGTLQLNKAVFTAAVKNGTADIARLFTGGAGNGGAFSTLNDLLTSYTQSNGTLSGVQTQLTAQVTRMNDQISAMQARLAIQRATLQAEFTAADAAMSQMRSDSGALANFNTSLTSS